MQPSTYSAYYPPGPDGTVQQTIICQPTKPNVVEVQGQTASTVPQVNDYLCWSILNLLFCCCPLGLCAIVYSYKTKGNIEARDREAADRNSRRTFSLNVSSLVIGIIIYVIFAVFYFMRK